ncbi:hypothetical protein E2562_033319 [Oryza meyeriana var. granulata]|uniref:Uncharacterized protein n=1 Tax=Oryza meyeriana var. granulata TaxID=110450 RepID=A0A6G1F154_9ORYZ|nr:hypothetical protein E2562_033319 [Oryza meyeriana var. granulata]
MDTSQAAWRHATMVGLQIHTNTRSAINGVAGVAPDPPTVRLDPPVGRPDPPNGRLDLSLPPPSTSPPLSPKFASGKPGSCLDFSASCGGTAMSLGRSRPGGCSSGSMSMRREPCPQGHCIHHPRAHLDLEPALPSRPLRMLISLPDEC